MPAYLPVPDGMELPTESKFTLPVTFEVRENQLYALEIDGKPLPDMEAEAESEMEEAEVSEQDFMSAVENRIK